MVVAPSGHRYSEVAGREPFLRWKGAAGRVLRPMLAVWLCSCSSTNAPGAASADAAVEDSGGSCLVCGDAADDRSPLEKVKGEIDRVCSQDGCHGSAAGGMGLHTSAEFGTMIDVPSTELPTMLRVRPGDPEQSYVYLKVACEGGIVDGCMPYATAFDPRIKQMFHDWIEAGAPTD